MNRSLGTWAWQLIQSHPVTSIFLLAILRLLYNKYASPLRRFPGPFLASCTRLWQIYVAWSGIAEKHYIEAHRRYGPVVRLGPNEVSFSSPFAALELFKTGKGYHKTDFYTVFLPDGQKDIFTDIRESHHALKKRYAGPAYSLAAVQEHTPEIEAILENFLLRLDEFCTPHGDRAIDLGNWLHYLAFDTLGQFAFSRTFGFIEAGNDMNGAINTISRSTYESGIIGQVPILDKFTRSNPLRKYIPFWPENNAAIFFHTANSAMRSFEDPESGKTESKSLLKSLLKAHRQYSDRFTLQDVLAISMGAVAAGSDSTASTMQSFIWHVVSNLEVYQKLVNELLTNELSDIVQYKEAQSLPYFQACLKETMRLQPAVAFNITRNVSEGGATIDGVWLGAGTKVAVNAWVMHRDVNVFGADADKFNPERWIARTSEQLKTMDRCMFQFGGGSHVCIGRHFALYEMNKILPELFRRYELRLKEPGKPLAHVSGFFYIQSGLHVYLVRRKSVEVLLCRDV